MDYRILFVYSDGSHREKYAATHTDVENITVQELRSTILHNDSVHPIVSITVARL